MKTLIVLIAGLFAMAAQAQTTFEYFTVEDQWPAFGECPNCSNIIVPGEFYCTGGGEPIPCPRYSSDTVRANSHEFRSGLTT